MKINLQILTSPKIKNWIVQLISLIVITLTIAITITDPIQQIKTLDIIMNKIMILMKILICSVKIACNKINQKTIMSPII